MLDKNLKIEIRPIPDRGDIRKFSDNLEYFSKSTTIPCLVDPETRKYATGLSEEDVAYLKKENFPYDLDDNWIMGEPHPFWESTVAKVTLGPSPEFLYPGKSLLDFVKYKYLLKSIYIYASEAEMEEGHKTEATHYIYNSSLENDNKAKKLERRNERIAKMAKLSLAKKKELLMIILNEDFDNKTDSYVTVALEEVLKNKEQTEQLDKLLDAKDKEVSIMADIKSAIYRNVLKKTPKGIFYFDTNLGFGEEEVREFLENPENQEIYLNIKAKNG